MVPGDIMRDLDLGVRRVRPRPPFFPRDAPLRQPNRQRKPLPVCPSLLGFKNWINPCIHVGAFEILVLFLRILLDAQANGSRGTGEGDEWNLFFFFFGCWGDKAFHSQDNTSGKTHTYFRFPCGLWGKVNTERRYTHTGAPLKRPRRAGGFFRSGRLSLSL